MYDTVTNSPEHSPFEMVVDENYTREECARLARQVLGLSNEELDDETLLTNISEVVRMGVETSPGRTLYSVDTRNPVAKVLVSRLLAKDPEAQTIVQILEILHDELSGTLPIRMTYGIAYPSYLPMLQAAACSLSFTGPTLHVLAGADTAFSISEFAATVGHVLPNSTAKVVDIHPSRLLGRWSELVIPGDVTRGIPFPDQSIATIHTNGLLDRLGNWRTGMDMSAIHAFFAQAAKKLCTGGTLILYERAPDTDQLKLVLQMLLNAGLSVQPQLPQYGKALRSRTALRAVLNSTSGTINKRDVVQTTGMLQISAQKQ